MRAVTVAEAKRNLDGLVKRVMDDSEPAIVLMESGEQVTHLKVNAVGPAEADDIGFVTCRDLDVGRAADYVVLFTNGAVMLEVLPNRL